MNMEVFECIQSRRSIRQFDSDRLVESTVLERIVEAGRLAPSAANRQPWRFLVLSSREWLDRVHIAYPRTWFMEAPHVLVVKGCSQQAWQRPADHKSFLETDLAIAMTHMTLMAWSEGVGSCWVSNFEPDVLQKSLGLGPEEAVYAMSPLGYPREQLFEVQAERERKPLNEVVLYL